MKSHCDKSKSGEHDYRVDPFIPMSQGTRVVCAYCHGWYAGIALSRPRLDDPMTWPGIPPSASFINQGIRKGLTPTEAKRLAYAGGKSA